MYVSPDDARSDVILAAATTLFGGFAISLLTSLPLYPRGGVVAAILAVAWVVVLTALVPWLLARYRGDRIAAFGLDAPRGAWTTGLVLALPVVVLALVRYLVGTGSVTQALLGRVGGASVANPVVGPTGIGGLGFASLLGFALFAATTVGALLLVAFLSVRGRDAFRSSDASVTELVRTFGMGSAAVALVLGALRAIGPARLLPVVLHVVALVVLVLLADRLVPVAGTVPRAAVVAPVVLVLVSHVFAFGGIFRGDLLAGLYTGALGAGTAAVIAGLVQTRARAWAVVPLVVALHWWPSCLSPLALELGAAAC